MDKSVVEVFGLRRNALVLTITSFVLGIGRNLVTTFISLYALHLGAPLIVLGLFSTIQGLVRILLVAPLGYLSDRIGHHRKWVLIAGDALSALAYFAYAAADSWVWLIPGTILGTGITLAHPASAAILADSINPEKRGVALATRTLTIMLPSTFTPFLGGILLDAMGMGEGMPLLLTLAGLLRVAGTLGRALFIKEQKERVHISTPKASRETRTSAKIKGAVFDMFEPLLSMRTLQIMASVSFVGAIGVEVLFRFQAVYAEKIIGLTNTEWGLVLGVAETIGTLLRIPLGRLTDVFGRRKCILLDYAVRPVFFIAFANARMFPHALVLNTVNNLARVTGMPAWEALMIDVTPRGRRGRVSGIFVMIEGIAGMVFPSIAAFLWEIYGPSWALYLPAIANALALLVILLFLTEPKQREE